MATPTTRLMRSRSDTIIAGVAGGIAQYLAIDSTIVRLLFVVLVFTGVGVLLYPLLWIIMPLEGTAGAAPAQAFDEMRQQATRAGPEVREVFVSDGSARRPRYDPMTGAPVNPESEIPINNLNDGDRAPGPTATAQSNRNRQLGIVLIGVGAFILLSIVLGPAFGKFLFPLALIAAGAIVLLRSRR